MAEVNLAPRAAAERQLHDRHMSEADFDQAPFTIAWEVTRACAFACVHCRADAQHTRDPNELTAPRSASSMSSSPISTRAMAS